MNFKIFHDRRSMGKAAADQAATAIRSAIQDHGCTPVVAATAASQKEFLEELAGAPQIDWRLVEAFHLDEYIGLPITHPGSFRKMLLDQLIQKTESPNTTCLTVIATLRRLCAARVGLLLPLRSTLHFLELAGTATWHSTTLWRISTRKSPIWLSRSTRPAVASK